jgi:hypothetical protein
MRMPVGRVADHPHGSGFSAHVEFEDAGPFGFLPGPVAVDVDTAINWACCHAPRVIVRAAGQSYTAGPIRVHGLPPWPRAVTRSVESDCVFGHRRSWTVEARTAWFRDDGAAVAQMLIDNLRLPDAIETADVAITHGGLSVGLRVVAPSEARALEIAFAALRDGWKRAAIVASPGTDYDVAALQVREATR